MSLTDTAGAGTAHLDTVLRLRARDGVVSRTLTRIVYAVKFARGTNQQAFARFVAEFIAANDQEACGLVVLQANSMFAVVETSPEAAVAFTRLLAAESHGSVAEARVVGMTEDAPSRAFGKLSAAFRAITLPSETVGDLEAQNPLHYCLAAYKNVIKAGQSMLDVSSGSDAALAMELDALSTKYATLLPSDERVCALASAGALMSLSEWLSFHAGPMRLDPSADTVLPLPPRIPY